MLNQIGLIMESIGVQFKLNIPDIHNFLNNTITRHNSLRDERDWQMQDRYIF